MSTTGTIPVAAHAADSSAAAAAVGRVLTAMVTPSESEKVRVVARRHNGSPFDGECRESRSARSVSGMTTPPRWDQ